MYRNLYLSLFFLFVSYLPVFSRPLMPTETGVRFVQNRGQWPDDVLFRAELPAGFLYLKRTSLHYVFYDAQAVSALHASSTQTAPTARNAAPSPAGEPYIRAHGVEMVMQGSRADARIEGIHPIQQHRGYFLGNDPSRWAGSVSSFGEILYHDIYPNIDLRLFAYYHTLKYEFIVRPGGDPAQIQLTYEGADALRLDAGQLLVDTSLEPFREAKPYSYVDGNGRQREVETHWAIRDRTASFRLPGGYDRSQTLTIDPKLVFSTYTGSTSDNWGHTATYDSTGNLYTAGTVFGASFPTSRGAYQVRFGGEVDVAIMKFSPDGRQLLYATYLGGTNGETPNSLIVNKNNELIIYGVTSSPNFPVSASAYQRTFAGGQEFTPSGNNRPSPGGTVSSIYFRNGTDLFLTKLSANGQAMTASTYLGGSGNDGISPATELGIRNYGDELRGEVGVDGADNVYVATVTSSANFPTVPTATTPLQGTSDAVVFRFNANLSSLTWSARFGGNGVDAAYGLKVTPSGVVYACGVTKSSNLPTHAQALQRQLGGTDDGFAARFENQSLTHLSYLGTTSADVTYLLDLDAEENVHVLGLSRGRYPVTADVYTNANSGQFIHALDRTLSRTIFSTVIGAGRNTPDIVPTALLVNECGNIYLSGWGGLTNLNSVGNGTTTTRGLPVTADAFKKATNGNNFWLALLEQGAKRLLYATYFGSESPNDTLPGPDRGDHVDGGTSRFDKTGVIYHAVCACGGTRFPTTPQAWSRTNNSGNCNNAAFKFDIDRLRAAFDAYEGSRKDVVEGCAPLTLNFVNTSEGGINYEWEIVGRARSTNPQQVSHTFDKPGEYQVVLSAYNPLTCKRVDVARKTVKVRPADFKLSADTTICSGRPIQLVASGAKTYEWTANPTLSATNVANPVATPRQTTTYTVNMTNEFGCSARRSVTVQVDDAFRPQVDLRTSQDCGQPMTVELVNSGTGADAVRWSMGNGDTLRVASPPPYQYAQSGSYVVTVTAYKKDCQLSVSVPIDVFNLSQLPNVVTANGDGKNDVFDVGFTGAKLEIVNRWGRPVFASESYANDWGRNVPHGTYYYLLTTPGGMRCKGWIEVLE